MVTGCKRLLSDLYGCDAQAESSDSEEWRDDYLVHLRWDSLVSETLVIPDTDLFDGRYLLTTDPFQLADRLGRTIENPRLPIEVRGRADSLEQSLASFLKRKSRETLNGFPFTAISDGTIKQALVLRLSQTPARQLDDRLAAHPGDVPGAVCSLLRDILRSEGLDPGVTELFESGWSRWLDAERRGLLRYTRWDSSAYDFGGAFRDTPPIDPDGDLGTDVGRETHRRLIDSLTSGATQGSDALAILDEARDIATAPDEAVEVLTIRRWFFEIRYRAFGRQHRSWTALKDDPNARPVGPHARLTRLIGEVDEPPQPGGRLLLVPEEVMPGLLTMGGADFRAFLAENRPDLETWWNDEDQHGLERSVESFLSRAGHPTTKAERPSEIMVIGTLTAALGLAGATASLGTLPQYMPGVVFDFVNTLALVVGPALRGRRTKSRATRRVVERARARAGTEYS